MFFLRQSTAITEKIGPFLDDGDGKTAETGLTIAQADVRLTKNGGAYAQKTEATSCTHDEKGEYGCPLDATDTGTLGRLKLHVQESGALPVWHEYMVIPQQVWDSLFSTDKLQVDATQVSGTSQTARDLGANVLLSSGTGTGQLDFTSGVVKSNLAQILGTALTETAGYIAAGFKKLFNVATPLLMASDVMVGTDGANTTVPDAAGTAAGLHGTTDGKIDALNNVSSANVKTQADAALSDVNLDHLMKTATVAADMTAEVVDNSVLSRILANGDTSAFVPSTDGLQPIRDVAPHGSTMVGTDGANTVVPDAAGTAPTAGEIRTEMEVNAGKLDHLWEMTEDDAGVRRLSTNALEQAPTGGTALTAQESRDAMKLAPTAGEPAAGSVDKHLDDVNTTTPPTATTIAAAVWDALTSGFTTVGSIGKKLKDWVFGNMTQVNGESIQNSGGYLLVKRDDGTTISGFDPTSEEVDVGKVKGAAVINVDDFKADVTNLDATVSSRSSHNAATAADAVWDEAAADHVAAGSTGAALGNATGPTAAQNADAVWDEAQSGHVVAGTFGRYLDAKVSNIPGSISDAATITQATEDVDGDALGAVNAGGAAISSALVAVYADADSDCETALYEDTSDGDGEFSIQVIAGATYRIKVTYSGYTWTVKRVTV